MDQSTVGNKVSKPLHKCPKCDRTFGNIGHMKCHFYRVHPEFKLAEFEVNEVVQTPKEKTEKPKPEPKQKPDPEPEKPAPPPVNQIPLNKIQQMLFKCETCKKCFTNKTSLLKHCVSVHGDDGRPFSCSTCDKTFPTAARLKSHEETHKKGRPCLECVKSPSKMRCTHNKKKRYVCKVCQRVFLYRNSLEKHMLSHEDDDEDNEDPFQCDVCRETFELQSHLDSHMLSSHSPEYQDEAIEESPNPSSVRPHKRKESHGEENPSDSSLGATKLRCEICDKTFARQCNLARHATMHKLRGARS